MIGIVPFFNRHRKVFFVGLLGLCMWGLGALKIMPSSIYPPLTFPRIVVIAEKGEESVENMMVGVTRPLEQALTAVPQLKRMRSKTTRGAAQLSLDFQERADMPAALSQTRARVAQEVASLGGDIEATVEQQTPS